MKKQMTFEQLMELKRSLIDQIHIVIDIERSMSGVPDEDDSERIIESNAIEEFKGLVEWYDEGFKEDCEETFDEHYNRQECYVLGYRDGIRAVKEFRARDDDIDQLG